MEPHARPPAGRVEAAASPERLRHFITLNSTSLRWQHHIPSAHAGARYVPTAPTNSSSSGLSTRSVSLPTAVLATASLRIGYSLTGRIAPPGALSVDKMHAAPQRLGKRSGQLTHTEMAPLQPQDALRARQPATPPMPRKASATAMSPCSHSVMREHHRGCCRLEYREPPQYKQQRICILACCGVLVLQNVDQALSLVHYLP
jgi:hypothetical protein